MNIRFKSIDIENFRSIQKAHIDLNNQGTVIVKGVNEYEDKATSNGSGKSSIFEALIFALFEETSSGEKNVANRIIGNGYIINLYFSVDDIDYTIVRECKNNKTSVILYKNDVDISARNKTDTNKMILDILGINKNIFLDSVFLSQNVSTNLASLSPTARKERLEVLTNTDNTINSFKEKIKIKQNEYEAKCVDNQMNINKLIGSIDTYVKQKEDIENKIHEIDLQMQERDKLGNIEQIEENINQLQLQLDTKNTEIMKITELIDKNELEIKEQKDNITLIQQQKDILQQSVNNKKIEYNNIDNNINQKEFTITTYTNKIADINKQIDKIKNSDTCPTCGRKYENVDEEHIKNTILELNNDIDNENNNIKSIKTEISNSQNELEKIKQQSIDLTEELNNVEDLLNENNKFILQLEENRRTLDNNKTNMLKEKDMIQSQINEQQNIKEKILSFKVDNKDPYIEMIKNIDNNIEEINDKIKILEKEIEENDNYVICIKHMLQLITKEFRTYLLQNSLIYLNNLLENYSHSLFSNDNDIIKIEGDDNKLNIYLGNATYESLSGGEKTRVNIALLLAQKSLASSIGNISCNLIILDEILGYCDSEAEVNVVDLITRELDSLESIYMVSHKEIPIGYDIQLVVTKNRQGLSNVRCY